MKISVSALLNVILITVLATSLIFMNGQSATKKYDPLVDVNDDGKIDILDLAKVASVYNTQGIPMNKSAFTHPGALDKPAYDSSWFDLNQTRHRVLTHNLSTTNVLVYMIGKYSDTETPYIHQRDYGGEANGLAYFGAYWYDLTETTIAIERQGNDENWNWVRVMIWKIMDP